VPAGVVAINGSLAEMILTGAGRWLCYLDKADTAKPIIGRIDTTTRKSDRTLTLEHPPRLLRLSPDGKTLVAAGARTRLPLVGMMQPIDVATFTAGRSADIEVIPTDLEVGEKIAFVGGGAGKGLHFLDLAGDPPPVLARWGFAASGTMHLAGKKLYLLQRFPRRVEAYLLPDKLTNTAPVPVRFDEQPDMPLGNDTLLTPDSKYLLCTSGLALRLGNSELVRPTTPAERKDVPEGPLRQLSAWSDGQPARVLSLAYSFDGQYLLTGDADRNMIIRNPDSGRVDRILRAEGDGVHGVAWALGGRSWAAASWGGRTAVVSFPAYTVLQQRPGGQPVGADSIAFSADSSSPAGAGEKGLIIWGVGFGKLDRVIPTALPLTSVSVATGTGLIAAGDVRGSIHLFAIVGNKAKAVFKAHDGEVRAVAFSLDGKRLASAGIDGRVKVHDPAGKQTAVMQGHAHAILALAFAPDGKLIASGSADGMIRLWNAETGKETATVPGRPEVPVWALAFAPDGKTLAGSCGREVLRWDTSGLIGPLLKVEGGLR
jgi:WD40 repeat protein